MIVAAGPRRMAVNQQQNIQIPRGLLNKPKRFLDRTIKREVKPEIVMQDRDTKFTKEFVAKLNENDVRTNALPKASPNPIGRCERN